MAKQNQAPRTSNPIKNLTNKSVVILKLFSKISNGVDTANPH